MDNFQKIVIFLLIIITSFISYYTINYTKTQSEDNVIINTWSLITGQNEIKENTWNIQASRSIELSAKKTVETKIANKSIEKTSSISEEIADTNNENNKQKAIEEAKYNKKICISNVISQSEKLKENIKSDNVDMNTHIDQQLHINYGTPSPVETYISKYTAFCEEQYDKSLLRINLEYN